MIMGTELAAASGASMLFMITTANLFMLVRLLKVLAVELAAT